MSGACAAPVGAESECAKEDVAKENLPEAKEEDAEMPVSVE